jgi:hypothetical protein
MTRRAGARVVVACALAGLATLPGGVRANTNVGPPPDPVSISTATFPVMSTPMMLFSIFNSDDGNLTITVDPMTLTACSGFTFAVIHTPHNTTFPVIIAPSEVVQILATAPVLTASTSCTAVFDAAGGSGTAQVSVPITVNIGTPSGTEIAVEPEGGLDFGTRVTADAVTQTIRVTNLGSAADTLTATASALSQNLALAAGPDNLFTCTAGSAGNCTATLAPNQFADIEVTCAAVDTQPPGVTITDTEGNDAPVAVTCTEQQTAPAILFGSAVVLSGMSGTLVTGNGTVSGMPPQSMSDAYLIATGTNIAFDSTDPACAGTYCTFGTGRAVPGQLSFQCTPQTTNPMDQVGLVVVHGLTDLDTTVGMVTCTAIGSGGGPAIDVAPSSLAFGNVPVGQSNGPMEVTISEPSTATSALTQVSVTIDDPTDYSLDCGTCQFASIAPGDSVMVGVTFTPTQGAPLSTTLHVTSTDATAQSVTITATGQGTAIVLDQPDPSGNPFGIHFGSIGRNSTQTATIQVTANGNVNTTTDLALATTGASLFALSGSAIPLTGGGSTGSVTLACGSSSAGSASGTVTLTTANAFAGSAIPIPVDCTVAPTDVDASPNRYAFGDGFGELRRDADVAPVMQTVTLTNNGTQPAMIGTVSAQPTSAHVAFTQPAMTTLAAGAMTTFAITVDPDAKNAAGQTFDEDLAATPVVLTIPVDTTSLTVTVTGKIVKAQTALTPPPPGPLDLGAVCVGGATAGVVTLVDTGTAHVAAMAPSIGAGFALGQAGSAELAPAAGSAAAGSAAVTIATTSTTTAGEIDGTLTWDTDVPDGSGDYQLAIKAEVVTSGAAVSPATLTFALQPPGISSTPKTIAVADCNPTPLDATVGNVLNHVGEASAWQISSPGSYVLPTGGAIAISVTFAPPHGGHYYAELPITAQGKTSTVLLTGDATGAADVETDFYACGCHGAGPPVQGWPVVVVMVGVARRSRRRARRTETRLP